MIKKVDGSGKVPHGSGSRDKGVNRKLIIESEKTSALASAPDIRTLQKTARSLGRGRVVLGSKNQTAAKVESYIASLKKKSK